MAELPYASEVMAFTDEELDHYLISVNNVILIHDPENLTPAFLQRLRDFYNPERRHEAAKPLDLDAVNARLAPKLTRTGRPRVPSPVTDESMDEEDILEYDIQSEEYNYFRLLDLGGRPLFPVEHLPGVARNPAAHIDGLLRPLQNISSGPVLIRWHVFSAQLSLWRGFLGRQISHRRSEAELAQFTEEAHRRLALVGLNRRFVFLPDQTAQDRLTTWAEYIDYECYFYSERRHQKLEHYLDRRDHFRARYLNWVIEQLPLIEQEMAAEKEQAEKAAQTAQTTQTREDSVNEPVDTADTTVPPRPASPPPPSLKQRRQAAEDGGVDDSQHTADSKTAPKAKRRKAAPPIRPAEPETSPREKGTAAAATAASSPPLRRSARIAAQKAAPAKTSPLPDKVTASRRRATPVTRGTKSTRADGRGRSRGRQKKPLGPDVH